MIYDKVRELPIFMGTEEEKIIDILEKVPFHFNKYNTNEFLVNEGSVCDEVIFLLNGRIRVTTPIYKGLVSIEEDFVAPYILPITNIFGRITTANYEVMSLGDVNVMSLSKPNFLNIISSHQLMLINVLNMLSSQAQRLNFVLSSVGEVTPEMKIGKWLLTISSRAAKLTKIDGDEESIRSLLGFDNTKTFLSGINDLVDRGFVEYQPGKISLNDRHGLAGMVNTHLSRK